MPTDTGSNVAHGAAGSQVVPVILCGGSGTRLWPLSRSQHPKQFLPLLSERSLFQETMLRIRALPGASAPVVVTNEAHRFLVREQLEELGVADAHILLEPFGRNTAPALALAAREVAASESRALLFVLPADHHIRSSAGFVEAVKRGIPSARHGAIVVFGVRPTAPETGYGYIKAGAGGEEEGVRPVASFTEKPDAETAAEYLQSGAYFWNSGMFLVRADVYLRELAAHAPDIATAIARAAAGLRHDGEFLRSAEEFFNSCRSESIDYAVMEHTCLGQMVELDAGWSDLGSWASLMEAGADGAADNVTRGDVLLADVTGSFIHSSGRLVAALGLRDQVVVETSDAVFVAPLARAEEVKQLVGTLKSAGREITENHLRVHRPWGWYECLSRDKRMQVKRIQVKPGAGLSLQLHHQRAEHWVVVCGEAEVTRGEEVFMLHENESTYIPPETRHRLRNNGSESLEIIEVQSGSYLGEDDIVRFDDCYGRVVGDVPRTSNG